MGRSATTDSACVATLADRDRCYACGTVTTRTPSGSPAASDVPEASPSFNLLVEPLLRAESSHGSPVTASLPELYAALASDSVASFPALRPHQRHAWHAFLVQLAAIAMHRAGLSEPPREAIRWRELLRGLTADFPDDEPWRLAVSDLMRPAFLQSPAGSREREPDYRHAIATPDELDMLVTSKNHDLKAAVATGAAADDWAFALVTLQTMEGFGGAGNYGISRMNGGMGSRPAFSLAPPGGPGAHVMRDVAALLGRRREIIDEYPMTESGHALLWTIPWDGAPEEMLLPGDLDPFYVEICRRVRLHADGDGRLSGVRTVSKAARIDSRGLNGRTSDPWTPVNRKLGKSLTLAAGGFTYKRVTEYLTSPDWERPVLLIPTPEEARSALPMRLVARAMVRGQGKTEGYHERIVPLRSRALRAFGADSAASGIGAIAQERIGEVATVQRILRHAIQAFLAAGDAERASPEMRVRARPWLNRVDALVDAHFFEDLQAELEAGPEERPAIRRRWLRGVVDAARDALRDAEDALPCRAIRRYRARVRAEALFEGRIRGPRGLPFLFDEGSASA